jgi:hypothetical protein
MTVFDKNGLLVEFMLEKDSLDAEVTSINIKATNSTQSTMSEFVFQAAVPKVCYSVIYIFISPSYQSQHIGVIIRCLCIIVHVVVTLLLILNSS